MGRTRSERLRSRGAIPDFREVRSCDPVPGPLCGILPQRPTRVRKARGRRAEREGFEPSVPCGYTRSPGVPLRPLGHLSGGTATTVAELPRARKARCRAMSARRRRRRPLRVLRAPALALSLVARELLAERRHDNGLDRRIAAHAVQLELAVKRLGYPRRELHPHRVRVPHPLPSVAGWPRCKLTGNAGSGKRQHERRGGDSNPRCREGTHDFESCRFNRAHAPLRAGCLPQPRGGAKPRAPPCAEEGAHERARALRLDAAGHRDAVVQTRVGVECVQRLDRTALGIGAAVDEPADPRLDRRPHAHRTGLDGDVEDGTRQPVIPGRARRRPQRQHLRMPRRVAPRDARVAGAREQVRPPNDNRADGHLAARAGRFGRGERLGHPPPVVGRRGYFISFCSPLSVPLVSPLPCSPCPAAACSWHFFTSSSLITIVSATSDTDRPVCRYLSTCLQFTVPATLPDPMASSTAAPIVSVVRLMAQPSLCALASGRCRTRHCAPAYINARQAGKVPLLDTRAVRGVDRRSSCAPSLRSRSFRRPRQPWARPCCSSGCECAVALRPRFASSSPVPLPRSPARSPPARERPSASTSTSRTAWWGRRPGSRCRGAACSCACARASSTRTPRASCSTSLTPRHTTSRSTATS